MRFALLASILVCAAGCSSAEGSIDGAEASDDTGTSSPADDTGTAVKNDGGANTDTGTAKADSGTAPKTDTGGGTPPPDTGGESLDAVRVVCVDEINAYRATLSLPPYAGWTSAATCADGQSKSDSESGTAHGAFGKCGESAQNECPGWPGPPDTMIKGCLKMMWAEGPGEPFSAHGHYINMSSTSYKSVACGFYKTPTGSYWAVQDFR